MTISPMAVPGDQYPSGSFMILCRVIREHLLQTVLPPLVVATIAYLALLQFLPDDAAQGSMGKVEGVENRCWWRRLLLRLSDLDALRVGSVVAEVGYDAPGGATDAVDRLPRGFFGTKPW